YGAVRRERKIPGEAPGRAVSGRRNRRGRRAFERDYSRRQDGRKAEAPESRGCRVGRLAEARDRSAPGPTELPGQDRGRRTNHTAQPHDRDQGKWRRVAVDRIRADADGRYERYGVG